LIRCIPNDYWEKSEIVHRSSGIVELQYYYKGVPALHVPLEGEIAKQIAGYSLIKYDLQMILSWLKIVVREYENKGINKSKQTVVNETPEESREIFEFIKGMMAASFSFYGKLFTQAEGRKIKLVRQIFNGDKTLTDFHDELILLRNNFSAHSGKERVEYVDVFLELDGIRDRNTRPLLASYVNQPNAWNNKFIDDFKNICEYLITKVDAKTASISSKYFKSLTRQRIDMFYEIAKM